MGVVILKEVPLRIVNLNGFWCEYMSVPIYRIGYNAGQGHTNKYNVPSYNFKHNLVRNYIKTMPVFIALSCNEVARRCSVRIDETYDYIIKMHMHNELPKGVSIIRKARGAVYVVRM